MDASDVVIGADSTARMVAELDAISAAPQAETVLERVRHAVLDWLGVVVAGAAEPSARIVRETLRAEGGTPVARVVGTPDRLTARQAALANGVAGHALDFDDLGLGCHPSVPVLPAVFAVADEVGADGPATVDAILHAYQAVAMVRAASGDAQFDRGFHPTGTLGVFGAAAGASRLLGLDREQRRCALGIAGTQASGLMASIGTMAKHLNAGNAAAAGVLAARLAARGFTGATDVVESPQGFAAAHGDGPADVGAVGGRLAVEEIVFKFHAGCGATHSSIEGIRAARARRPFVVDDVAEVELLVSPQTPEICGIADPGTGMEGMFSLRHTASLALAGRTTGPGGFTDAQVTDPHLIALRDLVRVTPDSRIPDDGSPAEVVVRLTSGETLSERVPTLVVVPDERLGEQWAGLEAKFHDLVAPVLGPERTTEVVELVRAIDRLDAVGDLLGGCATRA